jgi:predicted nuclease with TOPRIM domain
MEELVLRKIIETLTRLETKVDEVNDRTERIEKQLAEDEYQRYAGGIR